MNLMNKIFCFLNTIAVHIKALIFERWNIRWIKTANVIHRKTVKRILKRILKRIITEQNLRKSIVLNQEETATETSRAIKKATKNK